MIHCSGVWGKLEEVGFRYSVIYLCGIWEGGRAFIFIFIFIFYSEVYNSWWGDPAELTSLFFSTCLGPPSNSA